MYEVQRPSITFELIEGCTDSNENYIKSKKLRPQILPRFAEAIQVAWGNPWDPRKAGVQEDAHDWDNNLTGAEKSLISRILAGGFVGAEGIIGDNWTKISTGNYPIEVLMCARIFSAQECNHAIAYDLLESTLGIEPLELSTEFDAYTKLDYAKVMSDSADSLVNLGIFAAGLEGVSLMSSFAILENFSTRGLLGGMKRIMSWSRNDELLHSAMGIELFHYVANTTGISDSQVDQIIYGIDNVVSNEIKFTEWCFDGQDLPWLNISDVIELIQHLRELALYNLGLGGYSAPKSNDLLDYFLTLNLTGTYVDFFKGHNGEAYTVANKSKLDSETEGIDMSFLSEL